MSDVKFKNPRLVAVVLVDRANYGRMKPVMDAIQQREDLIMKVICAGSMVLERFGRPVDVVRSDGFDVVEELYIEIEGGTPGTMAKSVGYGVIEFEGAFSRLKPDLLLMIGDRFEALSAGVAASFSNIPIAHIQGGEVSGSVDESTRHCLTKLAQYHFPSTERASEYIVRMGEESERVFCVGCPSGDIALNMEEEIPKGIFRDVGSGAALSSTDPYLLVVYHPVTTRYGEAEDEVKKLLCALEELKHPTLWLWPNIDAGANQITKTLRLFAAKDDENWLHFAKNFSPTDYLKILRGARCAVGNSSSFIRDASFFGTPVVLLGDRQSGREIAENVLVCEEGLIVDSIKQQIEAGRYPASNLYGDGKSAQRIAEILPELDLFTQKQLSYVQENI